MAAAAEHSSCPADWAYPSVVFSSSKQKHEVEHNQTSIAITRRLVEFTLVMTDVQGTTANIARYHEIRAKYLRRAPRKSKITKAILLRAVIYHVTRLA